MGEHLNFLFSAFDVWRDAAHVRGTFDGVFSTALPGDAGRSASGQGRAVPVRQRQPLRARCLHQFGIQSGGNQGCSSPCN
ncbi:MAG: hypothetical protein WKF78_14910 [Candidatus Limnocylindrales bacterium]